MVVSERHCTQLLADGLAAKLGVRPRLKSPGGFLCPLRTVSKVLKSPARSRVVAPRPVLSLSLARTHEAGKASSKPALHFSVVRTTGDDAPGGVSSCVAVVPAAASLGAASNAAAAEAKDRMVCLLLLPAAPGPLSASERLLSSAITARIAHTARFGRRWGWLSTVLPGIPSLLPTHG